MTSAPIPKGWAAIAQAVIAAIVIGAGLALTGGPVEARKERRDRERESDLATLTGLVDCLAQENRGQLPDRLAPTSECDWQSDLADPFTGQPYRYERTGPRGYRLCAGFETPPPDTRGPWGRDHDGCISRQYIAASRDGSAATIPFRPGTGTEPKAGP